MVEFTSLPWESAILLFDLIYPNYIVISTWHDLTMQVQCTFTWCNITCDLFFALDADCSSEQNETRNNEQQQQQKILTYVIFVRSQKFERVQLDLQCFPVHPTIRLGNWVKSISHRRTVIWRNASPYTSHIWMVKTMPFCKLVFVF